MEGNGLPPEGDFYAPTDADALRMENELLAFEVRYLKARLDLPGLPSASAASASRLARLEDAERHLTMVLERLSGNPLGPAFRLHPAFRRLVRRYLYPGRRRASQGTPERLTQLEEAERDLTALVRRLSLSPFGRVLRTRQEFRLLEQRYLTSPQR